jgi:hypothetical protein
MEDIIEAVKEEGGVQVWFQTGHSLFSFREWIDMQINISHLVQYPGKYRADIENHRIVRKRHFRRNRISPEGEDLP